jgi:hypothetical protein
LLDEMCDGDRRPIRCPPSGDPVGKVEAQTRQRCHGVLDRDEGVVIAVRTGTRRQQQAAGRLGRHQGRPGRLDSVPPAITGPGLEIIVGP